MSKKVEFVLIANIEQNIIIGSYPSKSNYENEAKEIFKEFVSLSAKKQNFKYQKNNYHYLLSNNNIFYIIYSQSDIDDTILSSFFSELEAGNIYLLVDNKSQKLNKVGKKELQKITNDFNERKITSKSTKVNDINIELKETKNIMQTNIQNMVHNVDSMKDIEEKSVQIKSSSEDFKAKSKELSFKAMWENNKIKVLFICFIVLVVIVLIIYLCCKKSEKKE